MDSKEINSEMQRIFTRPSDRFRGNGSTVPGAITKQAAEAKANADFLKVFGDVTKAIKRQMLALIANMENLDARLTAFETKAKGQRR